MISEIVLLRHLLFVDFTNRISLNISVPFFPTTPFISNSISLPNTLSVRK